MRKGAKGWARRQLNLRGTDRILWDSRVSLSKRRESRLIEITTHYLQTAAHRPPWLLGARLATGDEDSIGIDVVFSTDAGELFIQVKSSEGFKRQFTQRGKKLWNSGRRVPITAVIVINDSRSDKEIIGELLRSLNELRDIVRIQGSNFMPLAHEAPSERTEPS